MQQQQQQQQWGEREFVGLDTSQPFAALKQQVNMRSDGSSVLATRAFQFAIRIYSIRYENRFESIRLVKNRPFDSLVVMQFFLFIYCIVSAKK